MSQQTISCRLQGVENDREVLTKTQRERLEQSRKAKRPVFVVTPEEALENEKEGTDKRKVWRFEAENVRDFAWASSRKFIWDAKGYQQGGNVQPEVMAMSFYQRGRRVVGKIFDRVGYSYHGSLLSLFF